MLGELRSFIKDNEIEIDWRDDNLYIWIPFALVEEFAEILGANYFEDGNSLKCLLQYDCLCIDLVGILEDEEIDPEELRRRDE